VNLVDIVLIVLLIASAIHGLKLGAAVQVMSFGGFWLGLLLGAVLAPFAAGLVSSAFGKALVSLLVLFGFAALLGGGGRQIGMRALRALTRARLGRADSGAGAVIAVIASLLVAWLVGSMLITGGDRGLSTQIEGSAILSTVDNALPPAPSVFSRIQRLISTAGFPQVFAGFAPITAGPVILPTAPALRAAVVAAGNSTVKVEGQGCGQIQEGSGFVVGPHLVVTNAHVVAGIANPVVIDGAGRHASVAVLFDPGFDLSILRVNTLSDRPLRLDPALVPRGTQGAVLGYPEGGPFNAQPAGIRSEFNATGRDIYGQNLITRAVYELQALVLPGNSGGPLVEPNGEVLGVVFSRSVVTPDVGYALASPHVAALVAQAEANNTPSGTGACAAG